MLAVENRRFRKETYLSAILSTTDRTTLGSSRRICLVVPIFSKFLLPPFLVLKHSIIFAVHNTFHHARGRPRCRITSSHDLRPVSI